MLTDSGESDREPSGSRRGPSKPILGPEEAGFQGTAHYAYLSSWHGQAVDGTFIHLTLLEPSSKPGGGYRHHVLFAGKEAEALEGRGTDVCQLALVC